MPQAQLFRLEAEVRCADGDCGKLRTLVISRGDDVVTHLVVESAHREGPSKIVPLGLVDASLVNTGGAGTAKDEVRLRCTTAEFERLDSAEATYFPGDEDYENTVGSWEPDDLWPYYASASGMVPGAPGTPGGLGKIPEPVTVDAVPDELPGEDEVFRGDHVHATDGDIGHVENLLADDANWGIRYLVIATRNWWPGKVVQLAPYAVKDIDWFGEHIDMNVSRDQVRSAPAWDPLALADQASEEQLHRHFGWPGYGQEAGAR